VHQKLREGHFGAATEIACKALNNLDAHPEFDQVFASSTLLSTHAVEFNIQDVWWKPT